MAQKSICRLFIGTYYNLRVELRSLTSFVALFGTNGCSLDKGCRTPIKHLTAFTIANQTSTRTRTPGATRNTLAEYEC